MPLPEDRPLRLLISFSPKDQELKDQLVQHLQVLVRFAGVDLWMADQIRAGENWHEKLDEALGRADVALLLISSDFLASDFLHDVEVPKLFARHEQGGVTVIPVLIRSCLWQAHPWLNGLKPLPTSEQPIASFEGDTRDRALTEVATNVAQRAGALPARGVAVRSPKIREPTTGLEEVQKVEVARAGDTTGVRPRNMRTRSDVLEQAMFIEKLVVRDFGPIKSFDVQLTAGLNIILGDNASGKTYLAEALYAILRNPQESQLTRALSREFREPGRLDTGFHLAEGPGWTVEITVKDGIARQVVRVIGAPIGTQGEPPQIRREVTPANATSESLTQRLADNHSGILFRADANLDLTNPRLREALCLLRDLSPGGRWRRILELPPAAFKQGKNTQFSNSEITLLNLAQAVVSQQYHKSNVPFIVDDPERSFDERAKHLLSDLISRAAQHTQVLLICHELPVARMREYVVGHLGEYGEFVNTTDRAHEATSIPLEKPATVTWFDTKLDHSMNAAVSVGDSSQAHGTLNVPEMTINNSGIMIIAGVTSASQVKNDTADAPNSRPLPDYVDSETRLLSEKLVAAQSRKQRLQERGADTVDVIQDILDCKRRLREGGQLKAGDSLGDGRYLLLKVGGRGGFATVWRAHDTTRDDVVAIKVLHSNLAGDPVRLERFKRGARIMSELKHEAVVRVLEPYGIDGGWHYFVMEYMLGGDLRRSLIEGRISPGQAIVAVLRISEALAEAHAQGIIHRDVKPANILLDEDLVPKLSDFDLVAAVDTTGGTRTGGFGTPIYAAPELMSRPMDADARADVFGLGMTAVFCLSGSELPGNVIGRVDRFIETLSCGGEVKAVLRRATDWDDAAARYANAAAFQEALKAALFASSSQVTGDDQDEYRPIESDHSSRLNRGIPTIASDGSVLDMRKIEILRKQSNVDRIRWFAFAVALLIWAALSLAGLTTYTASWAAAIAWIAVTLKTVVIIFRGPDDLFKLVGAGAKITDLELYLLCVAHIILVWPFFATSLMAPNVAAYFSLPRAWDISHFALLIGATEVLSSIGWITGGRFARADGYDDPHSMLAKGCQWFYGRAHLVRCGSLIVWFFAVAGLVKWHAIVDWQGALFVFLGLAFNEVMCQRWRQGRDRIISKRIATTNGGE